MADGDVIEIDGVRGVMMHIYHKLTFEYINSYHKTFEHPDNPGEFPVPGRGTIKSPPPTVQYEIAKWNIGNTEWDVVPDYRNLTTYDPTDHNVDPVIIEDLGVDIQNGWVLVRPYYFQEHKEQKYLELRMACSKEIYEGFTSNALGSNYHYPCKSLDQQTLNYQVSQANIDGNVAEPYKFWCSDNLVDTKADSGWGRRDHTTDQILDVGRDASTYVSACKDKFEARMVDYVAATDKDDLDAIIWI